MIYNHLARSSVPLAAWQRLIDRSENTLPPGSTTGPFGANHRPGHRPGVPGRWMLVVRSAASPQRSGGDDPALGRPLQPNPAGGPPMVPQALNRYAATSLGQPGVAEGAGHRLSPANKKAPWRGLFVGQNRPA